MKQKKILFTIPKVKSMYGDNHAKPLYPHVGIAYLTTILKKLGYSVKIFDDGVENDLQKLNKLIKIYKPDLIGITGFSYAYGYFEELIKNIKKNTATPIIAGGPHVSAIGKQILTDTPANFAMVGEAENSFPLFLKQFFSSKPSYQEIPGLIWQKNKQIIVNKKSPYIIKLDEIPFPDFNAFKFNLYPCYQEKIIPIITSRGCPYGCTYCSVRLSMGQCFRPRSAQNVFEEIKYWYDQGFNRLDINDDCFTLDLKRSEDICDLIINNKLNLTIQLYNGIRVDRISENLLRKLKQAGCIFISYGCESGSQKIINKIHKNITLKQVKDAVNLTNKVGIKNAVNFIIGHQGETYQDALKTLKFAQSLNSNFVNFYNLVPYPGTEAYDWAIKNANFLVPKDTFLKDISYRDNIPIFETKEFTAKQKNEIMKIGFNLYERKLFEFRLGKKLGFLVYLVTRNQTIAKLSHSLMNNKFFNLLISKLTKKSKSK